MHFLQNSSAESVFSKLQIKKKLANCFFKMDFYQSEVILYFGIHTNCFNVISSDVTADGNDSGNGCA